MLKPRWWHDVRSNDLTYWVVLSTALWHCHLLPWNRKGRFRGSKSATAHYRQQLEWRWCSAQLVPKSRNGWLHRDTLTNIPYEDRCTLRGDFHKWLSLHLLDLVEILWSRSFRRQIEGAIGWAGESLNDVIGNEAKEIGSKIWHLRNLDLIWSEWVCGIIIKKTYWTADV